MSLISIYETEKSNLYDGIKELDLKISIVKAINKKYKISNLEKFNNFIPKDLDDTYIFTHPNYLKNKNIKKLTNSIIFIYDNDLIGVYLSIKDSFADKSFRICSNYIDICDIQYSFCSCYDNCCDCGTGYYINEIFDYHSSLRKQGIPKEIIRKIDLEFIKVLPNYKNKTRIPKRLKKLMSIL